MKSANTSSDSLATTVTNSSCEESTFENDDMPKPIPGFVFRHFLHADAKVQKLITREDNYHIHKALGILSVISFFYRYGYVYLNKGTLGFDGPDASSNFNIILDWVTMSIHTLLALSSIIFRVPRKRISTKPMVIYEEYRQHAMVFTMRCFSVFAVCMLFQESQRWLTPVVVMAHHLLADRITSIHGTPGNTAVRATSGSMKLSNFYMGVAKLYSLYQFLAIASHILPNERMGDMAYNSIIAIQSSAFMMTLYRKRIIRGRTHMVVYAGCLVLSAFHIVRSLGWAMTGLTVAAFFIRIQLPRAFSNKYAVWLAFLFAAYGSNGVQLVTNVYSKAVELASVALASTASSSSSGVVVDMVPKLLEEFPAARGATAAAVLYALYCGERLVFQKQQTSDDATATNATSK
mmetsp:Transcript_22745/g.37959  ORF Transcript_22745/g.37959 Transcript_22745/m.37959 type:complete len:405 (+) Transcript_22745:60-1274(+)|eukprot:CAMPEP_0174976188 /NCGR_PEP_ID=MMETSP0004_2-20121128/12889_1 /TAXON_ID=420556 /ORGANISM="Ochromonas sp., Strain CCMP1393" /LENGTH=404 /DNA_ID=CAMNT_0016227181 /DNA_START=6 /DNA_END=1220 /DNA_ORIENTATION=-